MKGSVAMIQARPWLFWSALAIWGHYRSLHGTARTVRIAFTAEPRLVKEGLAATRSELEPSIRTGLANTFQGCHQCTWSETVSRRSGEESPPAKIKHCSWVFLLFIVLEKIESWQGGLGRLGGPIFPKIMKTLKFENSKTKK